MAPGSELTWTAVAGGPQPFPIPVDFYKYFVYGDANWDWKTFDFDKDVAAADEKFGALLNAIDPDLAAFKSRGGKLIMYHGWNDQLIQPATASTTTTACRRRWARKETDDFAAPVHGAGDAALRRRPGPEHVRRGRRARAVGGEGHEARADGRVALPPNGVVDRTRPLCPYPQVASLQGIRQHRRGRQFRLHCEIERPVMRPISIVLLALLAGAGLGAQGVQVVDLGGGIYQAVGAGIQGGSGVRIPQSNTFLIATSAGNVIVDTSIAAAARAHKDALVGCQGRVDSGDHPHARPRRSHRRHRDVARAGHEGHRPSSLSRVSRVHESPGRLFREEQRRAIWRSGPAGGGVAGPRRVRQRGNGGDEGDVRRHLHARGRRHAVRAAPHARRNARSPHRVDPEAQGRIRRRQLLRVVSEHVHAARHAAAVGARLRQLARTRCWRSSPRWCCPATARRSKAATRCGGASRNIATRSSTCTTRRSRA